MPGTSILTAPIEELARLLADCPAWRSWTGTATAEAALERIYRVCEPVTPSLVRPFAIISWFDGIDITRGGYQSGPFWLMFEAAAIPDVSEQEAAYAFADPLGDVVEQMRAMSEEGNAYILIQQFVMVRAPQRADKTESEDYFQAAFRVDTGVQG